MGVHTKNVDDGQGVYRTTCPFCGGKICVSWLFQYSRDYRIIRSGKLSKNYTRQDCGSMEVAVAGCTNCEEANWGNGEFFIDDGRFMDYKYVDG